MTCCCTHGENAVPDVAAPGAPAGLENVPTGVHRCRSPTHPVRSGRTRRVAALFKLALPIAALILIPKCPACVAAYALLFTGVSLSIPAAAAVRWTLIALSIAALARLLTRVTHQAARRGRIAP